jgi:hypothetical protein
MKTTMQASATVMRFCLRAEVFTKAGVRLIFIALTFSYLSVSQTF